MDSQAVPCTHGVCRCACHMLGTDFTAMHCMPCCRGQCPTCLQFMTMSGEAVSPTIEEQAIEKLAAIRAKMRSDGIAAINAERQRQLRDHGFDGENDQQYTKQELIKAAQSYLMAAEFVEQFPDKDPSKMFPPSWWPWDSKWWKPSTDPIRNLQKSGALIAAEIDRLVMAEAKKVAE